MSLKDNLMGHSRLLLWMMRNYLCTVEKRLCEAAKFTGHLC